MTFGKYILVKVKSFVETSSNLPLQTPRNREDEERENVPNPEGGRWGKTNNQTTFLKKKKKPTQ